MKVSEVKCKIRIKTAAAKAGTMIIYLTLTRV